MDRKFLTLDSYKSHFKAFISKHRLERRPFRSHDVRTFDPWPASRSMLGLVQGGTSRAMTFQSKKLIPKKTPKDKAIQWPPASFFFQGVLRCWVTSTPQKVQPKNGFWTKYSTQLIFQPEWKERNILVGGWTTQLKHMRGQIGSFPP